MTDHLSRNLRKTVLMIFGWSLTLTAAWGEKAKDPPPGAPAVPEAEKCSIDIASIAGIFAPSSPAFLSPPKVIRNKESLVETVVFKSGVTFEITQGGCEHFHLGFKAEGLPDRREARDVAAYLKLGSGLLRMKLRVKDQPLVPWLADNLEEAAKAYSLKTKKDPKASIDLNQPCNSKTCKAFLPCGNGTCEVLITKPEEQKTNLEISYSFAL